MRIIIPAAGTGNRLLPLTHQLPKCLVRVNGMPILYYLLAGLKKADITEVVIVSGHCSDKIEGFVSKYKNFPKIRIIVNKNYRSTNSIYSIGLTRRFWDQDFCIIDSDLLISDELLGRLLTTCGTFLIMDNSKPVEEIDMRVKVNNGELVYMDKQLPENETSGEFFGLSRWTPESGKLLSKAIDEFLSEGKLNVWYEFAIRELPGITKVPIVTCSSKDWIEIDTVNDYTKACSFYFL